MEVYKVCIINDFTLLFIYEYSNIISLVNINTMHKDDIKIFNLDYILDAEIVRNDIFFVGRGQYIVKYNLISKKTNCFEISNTNDAIYTSIRKINDLFFIANMNAKTVEVWNTKNKKMLYNFFSGEFVREIIYDNYLNIIIVLTTETEDFGYLLFFHLSEEKLYSLNVRIECLFAPSSVKLFRNNLIIVGGYPPLNIQIHEYPSLSIKKELILYQDYPKNIFGCEMGITFFIDYSFINQHQLICPYAGGDILLIDIINNTCKIVHKDSDTYIFSKIIKNNIIIVSKEGNVIIHKNIYNMKLCNLQNILHKDLQYKDIPLNNNFNEYKVIDSEEDPIHLRIIE